MESIFVECEIHAPIDRVWELTQTPELHGRWDLRFSSITYLPKEEGEPQQFLYETRIGFGLKISGKGESVGEKNKPDGTRTSALKFWSDEQLSLIQTGSGYWQYEPQGDESQGGGTQFRTRYDYVVRHGAFGRGLDIFFRPLIGWATAWSFDSLRLWAEKGVRPEESRGFALVHLLARGALAFVWIYHGLVPKLLFPMTGEIDISVASGIPRGIAPAINTAAGIGEVLFGLALLVFWRARWMLAIQIPLLIGLLAPIALTRPALFTQPFQPLTLNLLMIVLALCGFLTSKELPSARNCRRKPR